MNPQNDPFEHFWEQEQSRTIVEHHKEALIREAKAIHERDPIVKAVALIACAGSSEARGIVAQERGPTDPEKEDVVRFVTRATLVDIVRHSAPALREHLLDPDPEWQKDNRRLPVLVATKHGHRMAYLQYDAG